MLTGHSKHTRVKLDPERVHWGQTPFRVKDDPEIGQLSADLTNNGVRLTQLWVIFRFRLTDFRVNVDPEWSLAPMDPSRVKFDPGVFRVEFSDFTRVFFSGKFYAMGPKLMVSSAYHLTDSYFSAGKHIPVTFNIMECSKKSWSSLNDYFILFQGLTNKICKILSIQKRMLYHCWSMIHPPSQGCNESFKFWVESSHLVSF